MKLLALPVDDSGEDAEQHLNDLLTALENEAWETNKVVSSNLSELVHWLARRGEAIVARVRHTLLRLQSDALAYALRKANDECGCLKRQREFAIETAALLAKRSKVVQPLAQSANTEASGKPKERKPGKGVSSASAVRKAVDSGKANLKDAARKLERTSSELRDWRTEVSRKVLAALSSRLTSKALISICIAYATKLRESFIIIVH